MEVLLVEPGKEARIAEIGNNLKSLQAAVAAILKPLTLLTTPSPSSATTRAK